MSEALAQILNQKKNTIDLQKVGVIATSLTDDLLHPSLPKYLDEMMKFTVAQAMLQGIGGGMTEAAIEVREISPFLDLLDGQGNKIKHNQWIQPNILYSYFNDPTVRNYDSGPKQDTGLKVSNVYHSGRESRNDQKIIMIYGLEFLNDFKSRNVEFIDFWRANAKLVTTINIDRNQKPPVYSGFSKPEFIQNISVSEGGEVKYEMIEHTGNNKIYHNNILIMRTPVMFKKDDLLQIRFRYSNAVASHDEIKFKGFVAEAIGTNLMG